MSNLIIYALLLESDKFYIGKTSRVEGVNLRFYEHVTGRGSEWTKKYKPISIIEDYEHNCSLEEDVLTKKYMIKYGIENVRGGSYTKIDLEQWQIMSLEHEFKSVSDKCFKCGKNGHFANQCRKGLYPDYILHFQNEEQLEQEILRLENIRIKVSHDKYKISQFKYIKLNADKSHGKGSKDVEEKFIEIEPSIIDKYNMRKLSITQNMRNIKYNNINIQEVTGDLIYSHILGIVTNNNEISNNLFIKTENVIETIYKIYIFRKRLERNYTDLVKDFEHEDKNNFDEILKEANKKIELLYEKLAKIM
jgi:predicted GIY-YIG superfamily endonuclease